MFNRIILCCAFFLIPVGSALGQSDTARSDKTKTRKIIVATSSGVTTIGSLLALHQAWYKDYNTGKFHFFNDNQEWLQMDKAGHVFTTYQLGRLMMGAFEWAGYDKQKKLFIGGGLGFAYMTGIEIMDGFSRGWGFSWGDQLANLLGTSLAIGQQAFWNEQRLQFKFSYARSGLAKYNPSLLGKNDYTQLLKDYNGQTYWLSVNPTAFVKKQNRFPKWLNLALGYSAYGMLGGHENNFVIRDEVGNVLKVERQRRFYLSLDVDLTRIKTKSRFLKSVFSALNILKFPAPALELNNNKLRFYALYY